jgi:hypothetical protein
MLCCGVWLGPRRENDGSGNLTELTFVAEGSARHTGENVQPDVRKSRAGLGQARPDP